ncbi:MAG: hypothetical protein ACI857_002128 [Arenicella sp.]|jgi:hypothetical protein
MLCFSVVAHAQKKSVIKLKNGSEIKGHIIDTNENETKIETKDGSVFVFKSEEIAGIEESLLKVSGKGVYTRASLGMLGGEQFSPSFQLANGYSFNANWDLGLLLGAEKVVGSWYVPVMVNGRYNLLKRPNTPFLDISAGYQMPLQNWENDKGGFTGGASLGFSRLVGDRIGLSTSLGYRYGYLVENSNWWDDFVTIRQINRFDLRFAITFK